MKQFNFNALSKTPNKFYHYTCLNVKEFLILTSHLRYNHYGKKKQKEKDYPDPTVKEILTMEDTIIISDRNLNKTRVKIKHSILLRYKKFNILKQIYRHSLKDYHQRFQIIAWIVNFQLRNKENFIPLTVPSFYQKEMNLANF